jgi:DNA-directed RNA polymerase specialized sigma24 family protein
MTDVDRDDTTLVRRAIGGDGDALEQLVQAHQTWVYNVAVRMLGHPHDAEDATQEIFIKTVTRLASGHFVRIDFDAAA